MRIQSLVFARNVFARIFGHFRPILLALLCSSTVLVTVGVAAAPVARAAAPNASTQTTAPTNTNGSASSATTSSGPVNLLSKYATTTVQAGGVRKTQISSTPLNYQSGQTWQPINNSLVATSGGGWHNTANSWSAQLPTNLSSPVTLSNGSSQIGFTLEGAGTASANDGTVSGSTATYANALSGTTVSEQVVSSGIKETLSLASAAASSTYTWDLSLSSGFSARAASSGGLDIDSSGTPIAEIAPPTVSDAAGNVGTASFALSQDAKSVTLSVDPTWLNATGRAFPVTVDPSVAYLSAADGCTISSATPTTASCASTDLGVGVSGGNVERSLVHFGQLNTDIPVDGQVLSADLDLPVDTLSGSVTLNAYPLTRAYSNSAATWNSYDGTNSWTTAGGDYASTPTVSGVVPSSGSWDVNVPTATIQGWVDGSQANDGFLLKASNESSGTNLADFDPSDWYGDFLDVYWTPNTGVVSGYPIISHTLDDHLSLGVNAADGNLIVHATDLSINGDAGQKEVVDRYYNSEDLSTYGGLGDSWNFGEGSGVFLEVFSDNVTAFLPGDQVAVFLNNGTSFTTPAGVDAVLTKVSSGDYTLVFNSSQEKITFQAQSCSSSTIPETSVADRNGETISYGYSATTCDPSGDPMLTTITDTEGRTTTVSDNGYTYTGITDPQTPTARTVGLAFTGSGWNLTQTEDTSGNYTYYSYASGSSLLTQIEDPNGNYTEITYNGAGQVSTVTYVTNVSAKTGPTYTYSYTAPTYPNGGSTTVTDPNGHTTTYTYSLDDQVTKVTDGNGDTEQTTYSSDNQPHILTDGMTSPGVSTLNYDSNDNETSTEEPLNSGTDTPATSYTNYQTGSGPSGSTYLPSSSVTSEGNCSYYKYDNTYGDLTDVYSGTADGSGGEGTNPGCTTTTSAYATHTSTAYDGIAGASCTNAKTGEVCSTTDGDGNTTNYAYDSSGDLASVTPPSPQGATTYTYDSLSRVATVTNGDGNTGTPGTIVPVQSKVTNISSGDVSSQTTTLSANTTKGDTVVVIVSTWPVSPVVSVSSISGGGVGTWHLGKASSTTTVGDEEIWYGYANTGGAAAITVNMSAGTTQVGTQVIEYSGVASSSPIDVTNSASGSSSTTVNTPSLTTTAAGDLIVDAANAYDNISASPASPWVDYVGPTYGGSPWTPITTRVVGATGTYSTSWSQSPAGPWVSVGIALKPATETTSYSYDAMDRVTQILYGGDAACIPSSGNCITYTYDADGNVTQRVDSTGTYTFTYDALNRLIDKGTPSGTDACSGSSPAGITYSYDGASNLTTSCDALGTTHYYYDAGNRLTSQVEPGGSTGCAVSSNTTATGCTAYSYDADNHLTTTLFPGGAKQTSSWTPNGKMQSIVGKSSSGATDTSYAYTYISGSHEQDLVNSRVENDSLVSSSTTVTYGYDMNNELTSAVTTGGSSSTLDYYYDEAGNRCSAAPTTPTVCPSGTGYYAYNADDELTAGPGGSDTYDGAGNQTSDPQLSNLTYNSENQTSSITPSGGGVIALTYANTGQAERTSDGSTTFVSGDYGLDRSVNGSTTTYFIRNNVGTVIGEHIGGSGGTSYYYLTDNEGSITAVITASGAVQDGYAYDPYGQVTPVGTASVANPLGYAGGYTEPTSGIVKFGTRYYNASVGLFTQEDPSGQNTGYLYAGNDPVNVTDPSGMSWYDPSWLNDYGAALGDELLSLANDIDQALAACSETAEVYSTDDSGVGPGGTLFGYIVGCATGAVDSENQSGGSGFNLGG
jgi:RHS repeat-associated protein